MKKKVQIEKMLTELAGITNEVQGLREELSRGEELIEDVEAWIRQLGKLLEKERKSKVKA